MSKNDLTLERLGELLAYEKAAANASASTLAWYTGTLRRYGEWLGDQNLAPTLAHFTYELVQQYILDLQQQRAREYHRYQSDTPSTSKRWRCQQQRAREYHRYQPPKHEVLSDQSVNTYVRALRGFSTWLYTEGYTAENILGRLKAPKVTQRVQDILTIDEISQIVNSLNVRTEIGARDQAIFLLLLDTCMRAGELCSLTLDQLHLEDGYCYVLGKGRKMRPVKVGARAAKAVRFYLLHWRKPAQQNEQHVFLTCTHIQAEGRVFQAQRGTPLSVNALDQAIKRLGRRAGVPRLHPHLLRHTASCLHLKANRDPFALKSLLGHTTLSMTQHYVAAVQAMDVIEGETVSIVDGLEAQALTKTTKQRKPRTPRPIERRRRLPPTEQPA